jgi:PleD family two-component response regulator
MIKQIIDTSATDRASTIILLVDDDRLSTAILSNSLEKSYKVHVVHSGEEAIAFCQQRLPDLILLDVMMPNLDGHVTCKILRTLEGMQDCPIIFSTSLTGIEDEIKCWEAGGTDFLAKPVSPVTLLMRVQAHTRLKSESDTSNFSAILDGLTGLRKRRHFDNYNLYKVNSNCNNDADL